MMKKTILIAIATTLLCSCNKEVDETGNITLPERPISIYTAIQSEKTPTVSPQTRAAITGTDAELKDITFYLWQSASSTTIDPTSITPSPYTGNRAGDATGAITFIGDSKPLYAPDDSKHALLVGCWPATTTTATNSLIWDIDGKTDILISDLWYAGTYTNPIPGTKNDNNQTPTCLTFKHRLAQLEVICKAAKDETLEKVQATWGNIKSIKLLDAYSQMAYNYTTNEITYTGKANIPLVNPNYTGNFAPIAIGTDAVTAAGMYAPAKAVILCITTEGATNATTDDLIQTFAVQFVKEDGTNAEFEAGKKYTVTILFPGTLNYPQIEMTIDWTSNPEASNNFGGINQGTDLPVDEWDKNPGDNDSGELTEDYGKNTSP